MSVSYKSSIRVRNVYDIDVANFCIVIYSRRLLSLFPNIFLTAIEVGVNLKEGYNGDISARDAGRIGGNMVRKLIMQAESQMANK